MGGLRCGARLIEAGGDDRSPPGAIVVELHRVLTGGQGASVGQDQHVGAIEDARELRWAGDSLPRHAGGMSVEQLAQFLSRHVAAPRVLAWPVEGEVPAGEEVEHVAHERGVEPLGQRPDVHEPPGPRPWRGRSVAAACRGGVAHDGDVSATEQLGEGRVDHDHGVGLCGDMPAQLADSPFPPWQHRRPVVCTVEHPPARL